MPSRSSSDIQDERIELLNTADPDRRGDYVLYWMQQSQRASFNPALELAVQQANELGKPLLVAFGLTDEYPEANLRHYSFMLEGLADVGAALRRRRIKFALLRGSPDEVATRLGRQAALVVTDRGYLRHQKRWRAIVARALDVRVVQVEGDVVVPVETVSDKAEYAARTIRPKLHRQLERFLVELKPTPLRQNSLNLPVDGEAIDGPEQRHDLLESMDLDRTVPPVGRLFRGGTTAARMVLRRFLEKRLGDYVANRNQPQTDSVSHLSKYLHFGHISPVEVALAARRRRSSDSRESFIEELVVRRELAQNYAHFTPGYDRYAALPRWARQTLKKHAGDRRPHRYTARQLDEAATHDPYWNAAMREMKHTGFMHNYMRMYWGKKILEWSGTPRYAFRTALALNNRYFLDGRDPNSYTGVAWCFGLHDRPWAEREIFGTVRFMSAGGLERKADPEAYVEKVDRLVELSSEGGPGT